MKMASLLLNMTTMMMKNEVLNELLTILDEVLIILNESRIHSNFSIHRILQFFRRFFLFDIFDGIQLCSN